MAFTVSALERCHKETEETVGVETAAFLQQNISYLKAHQEEFLYAQSSDFAEAKIDAVVLEFDEMFKVYTALFGLRLQKKVNQQLKAYLRDNLKGMLGSSSAMFSGDEGLWEVNIALDAIEGFTGEETFEQAYELLIDFVIKMLGVLEA
ncbi:hypothetical protein [Lysinibacillus sp. LZ02]|uniref:hypothetical protein n=1 Tax=Lysinibacillus sp. LZ02 TaxID=3420668 RepID=UPI003D36CC1C